MRTLATIIVTLVVTACGVGSADAVKRPHKACPTEDSVWCVWDARHMGNGRGDSFWTDHKGNAHYVSHKRAHRMIGAGR